MSFHLIVLSQRYDSSWLAFDASAPTGTRSKLHPVSAEEKAPEDAPVRAAYSQIQSREFLAIES